ncbi:MAG TPA: dual specificity protein phosphatase family protein [Gemmataceae bacterium]|jgi:atypical dual specificity phosphatase|nr:dual specificity protein phosphatase family protein [Gemmataceae bacterium]
MAPPPHGFSWIEKPLLAGLAQPESEEDLDWLRKNGIDVLLSLTEEPIPRAWVNNAGLLLVHEPLVDMEAPVQEQLERCVATIDRAVGNNMGVAVHCGAGLGRTGVVLAAYLIRKGASAREAITRIRKLRPGSIETSEQADAVVEYGRQLKRE